MHGKITDMTLEPSKMPTDKPPTRRWLLAVVVIAILLGIAWLVNGINGSSEPSAADRRDIAEQQALSACEDRVAESMRSPSTATFGGSEASLIGSTWHVDGYVDAQNGFGATVRADFECTAIVNGEMVTTQVMSLEQR